MKIKAVIKVWNGGSYGRMGEYTAIVEPELFKNGKIKTSKFKLIEILETTKKGYRSGSANSSENISEVLEVLED